jgi:tetratricopeptide (TPR) repeat protein
MSVYAQVGSHKFINFDDDVYVTNNLHVVSGLSGKNIIWAFTSVGEAGNWHPITWLSHMADVQFYGISPAGHHITSAVIHTVSAVILLLLLFRFTGSLWQSTFVATMFAIHPMHVESVAWVAERKDVLSAFFGFLTLFLYCEFVSSRKPVLYIFSLFCFVLGLMSKPMLVTLPIVMLLMDFWPLERCGHKEQSQGLRQRLKIVTTLVIEKIPFFACSIFSSVVAIYAQRNVGATNSLYTLRFMLRIENALICYVKYIFKTLWPHDMAVFYPLPKSFQFWQVIGSLIILLLISVTVIRAGRRFPYLSAGWFWFLITLAPVIGFVQVGSQSMADRYSYIPSIGLFIMAAWGIPALAKSLKCHASVVTVLAGAVIVASVALTWQQLGYWRDDISLYRHTLQVTTGNHTINYNLGIALANKGDYEGAIKEFREALKTKPFDRKTHGSLGIALANTGDIDAAIQQFQEVLRIDPNDTKSQSNLRKAIAQKNKRWN